MGITRKSLFGFPPRPNQGSEYTQREVPFTGVALNQPWPLLPPGSSYSMTNYVPANGRLTPRSRLSSVNTIRSLLSISGMVPFYSTAGIGVNRMWLSHSTLHGLMDSSGSISKASFVSSFGLGVANIAAQDRWQYTTAFAANLSENMIVAAGGSSYGTLQCLYQANGSASGQALYSYLTSAPKALCVGSFDNYVLAWNCNEGSALINRLRWCQRGSPSNWTSEGSGFEDLLDMKGSGSRVMGTADQRVILFTDLEIWYGTSAAYPAQFQFSPLDRGIGCIAPNTAVDTDVGIIFLGSDAALRVLPKGGGQSQIVSAAISEYMQNLPYFLSDNYSFGVYDPFQKLYYLVLDSFFHGTLKGFVLNVITGEWGFIDYNTPVPICGTSLMAPATSLMAGKVFFGNSTGTVQSLNSVVSMENGSAVTSKWQSPPIASDLPGNYKQLTEVDIDYRATSLSTITLKVSQDGGNTFESSGRSVILSTAAVAGRATSHMYVGGAFPAIELTSTSTGYELHRLDIGMTLGGRKSG